MITKIEDFFTKGCGRCDRFATDDCSSRIWSTGIDELRGICLRVGLLETLKWGHPCYMHAGRNIAIIGALRGDFRLNFFDAALMQDPARLLEKQGPNTRHPDMIRFTDPARVQALAEVVESYLREAMGYAERGVRPSKDTAAIELPPELEEALASDSELAEAFHRLTPGRQRSYVINLSSVKKSETRVTRIAKFRSHILAGKGAMER